MPMSTAILTEVERETRLSPEPLPMETDAALYELVNGLRVEMPSMSIRAVTVATRLTTSLNAFARPRHLGEAFSEMLIQVPVPADEDRNRRPDVCFISIAKLAAASPEDPDANAWAIIPDLAIEVTSPTDRAEDQREKVQEYLQLGVRCVWVVYPKLRIVDVYESSGLTRTFGPDGVLPGDPVLPGLEVPLNDLFRPIGPTES
jgi:Uma2 family endonuclease